MKADLIEKIRATLPDRIARWAEPLASAAIKTAPSDFPGGVDAWAFFGGSVLEEETLGGDGAGYTPKGEWFGTGDSDKAETPWQLDRRYHAQYLSRGDRTRESDSIYAMNLLADNWRAFSDVDDPDLRIAATAASYNASRKRVRDALAAGQHPDMATYPRRGAYVYASEISDRLNSWRGA